MQQAAQAYLGTQIATTSQGQILLMLYDGAVNFLERAKTAMAAKDYGTKGNLISRAIDVIDELDCSLNAEKGGNLSANLHELYFYCSKRLFMANLKMDAGIIDEVIKILSGLRSAYAEIIDRPEAVIAAAQAAAQRQSSQCRPRSASMPAAGDALAGQNAAQRAYVQQGAHCGAEEKLAAAPAAPADAMPPALPASAVRRGASAMYQKYAASE